MASPIPDKPGVLLEIVEEFPLRTVVFCNTIAETRKLAYMLRHLKHSAAAINGDMS